MGVGASRLAAYGYGSSDTYTCKNTYSQYTYGRACSLRTGKEAQLADILLMTFPIVERGLFVRNSLVLCIMPRPPVRYFLDRVRSTEGQKLHHQRPLPSDC